jgi:hypothetical protein
MFELHSLTTDLYAAECRRAAVRCRPWKFVQSQVVDRIKGLVGGEVRQLTSLSMDPERDSPRDMREWLAPFRGMAEMVAVRATPADLTRLRTFLEHAHTAGCCGATKIR